MIQPICTTYGVTYVATRGFPSVTLIYESALAMGALRKPTHVYYFGDHDASGRAISANLEADLCSHGANVIVQRVALEPQQISDFDLPTRPGKTSDSRHAKFAATYGDECVELDALPPNVLSMLVELAILREIDTEAWARMASIERLERQTLSSIATLDIVPGTMYTMATQP